jgi:hypothetical protein
MAIMLIYFLETRQGQGLHTEGIPPVPAHVRTYA